MQPAEQQHSLRELAAELGRSKRTLQLWAQELPDECKQQRQSDGAIMLTDAGAELLRQRAAQRPAQGAKTPAQDDCAPREISREITQQAAKKPRNSAETRENNRETAQISREISHPIAQPDSPTEALAIALDALQQTIDRQAAELLQMRGELATAEARAFDANKEAAIMGEKLRGLQLALTAEKDRTAQQAAEIAAQQQTIERLTEQLAAIADKQADALRAGAAEQLALALPEQQPEKKRGLLARLFRRNKAGSDAEQ